MSFEHETVLLTETVDAVRPTSGGTYVDATLGGGGHSELLLKRSSPDGRLVAFDQDETAIRHAKQRLSPFEHRALFVRANFREMAREAEARGISNVDGIVFDLGVSSPQFDEGDRGFSYRFDAPLDMRMNQQQQLTAEVIVNEWPEEELASIFFQYGEEKFSRRIARRIVEERTRHRIVQTGELAELIKLSIPAATRRSGPHPARRTFQALRIAVNDELGALEAGIQAAFQLLRPGGRLSIITFHSLEDRIVKHAFKAFATWCICPPELPICQCGRTPEATLVTRKPIAPSEEEIESNPRARSAKLRVLEKAL